MCLTHNNEPQTELGVDSKTPVLVCLCGLQGSGKSTYANELVSSLHIKIVSSDAIRKEFPSAKNDTVFQIVYKRINEYLKQGFNVCLDATNTTIKARKQIFLNVNCMLNRKIYK